MFTRRAFYHPYKSPSATPKSSPAGFRFMDYISPRRCFEFLDARSPDPSPLSSPVRGPYGQEDDGPPLAGHGLGSPFCPSSPKSGLNDASPRLNGTGDAAAQDRPSTPTARRKVRYGPKSPPANHHIGRADDHSRPGPFSPHHRRTRQTEDAVRRRILDRHESRVARARRGLCQLQREADRLMTPEHMDDGDRIFLAQLGRLVLDQTLNHDLERCRERMARAAAGTTERQEAHAQRDQEAVRTREACQDPEAREEQKRKVAAFVQEKADQKAVQYQQMEEAAMRADDERRRVHEARERQIREEQERIFHEEQVRKAKEDRERQQRAEEERRLREERERQQQEERERQLREETERKLREEEAARKLRDERARRCKEFHEWFMRDERERQARILAEQARRAAEEEAQVAQQFATYEGKWHELRTSDSLPPIDVGEMPWPVFGVVTAADQITYQGVRAFLFHPRRPGIEGKTARDKVKTEMLRFHPDKFNTRIVPKIHPSQQATAQAIAGAVVRILTGIMTEEVEQEQQ